MSPTQALPKQSSHRGFSLTEMILQMTILTIVTLPMLMLLNLQKDTIEQNKQNTVNQVQTDMLLNNITIQHPNVTGLYTVDTETPLSIHCDPATKTKTSYATCESGGADVDKGPFFRRFIDFSRDADGTSNYQGVVETVELYKSNEEGASPYFKTTRFIQLDAYHVHYRPYSCVALDDFSTIRCFENAIITDTSGNPWYPSIVSTTGKDLDTDKALTYYQLPSACISRYLHPSNPPPPFNNAWLLTSRSCASGMEQRFKVLPNQTYDINVYFTAKDSDSPSSNCLSNTSGVSCQLADITISVRDSDKDTTLILNTFNNFDIIAASRHVPGTTAPGTIFHQQVTTPRVTDDFKPNELVIQIKPTPAASTTEVAISAIEVNRRSHLSPFGRPLLE